MRSVALLVGILLSAQIAHAANGPRWSSSQLAEFADVVLTGHVRAVSAGWDADVNAIYTFVTVEVAEVLKGDVSDGVITVKQLGGRVGGVSLSVTDQPTFRVGESVLLYLEARPRDGTLYTSALWQGKWDLHASGTGQQLASRRVPGGHGAPEDARDASDLRRQAASARRVSRARVTSYVAAPAMASDAPVASASSGFNLLGPFRYLFSPAVDVQANGQPGLAGGGFTQVQSALLRWNAAGSAFRYIAGSTSAAPRCSAQLVGSGRVTISFMDPCGEMSNEGGTLALGGSYYVPGEGGTSNGRAFDRAVEGFVVNNDSPTALTYLTNPGCFEDIQTHELGHVLGLNHSADPSALMYATIDSRACMNGARGLRPDDVAGVQFIYGSTSTLSGVPPSVAPSDVRVTAQAAQLSVTWRELGQESTASATSYRIDFRTGHQDNGALVASVVQPGTSLVVHVPAGVSGPFNVVVTGLNAAGAGPPSQRRDFTLQGAGATCQAAPPAVGNLTASVNAGYARVQWSAAAAATHYLLQAGSAPGQQDLVALSDLGTSTLAGAAVPAGFRGWVRVYAANACGRSAPADVFVH